MKGATQKPYSCSQCDKKTSSQWRKYNHHREDNSKQFGGSFIEETRDLPGDALVLNRKYNLENFENGIIGIFFNGH